MQVELPWPPKELNPNARGHWSKKWSAGKNYRRDCGFLCQGLPKTIHLKITFFPPDNRKRDRDNCIAMFKAGQDGISDAMDIDDSEFVITYAMGEPVKPGRVLVEAL